MVALRLGVDFAEAKALHEARRLAALTCLDFLNHS
jgi:hypothetical protein